MNIMLMLKQQEMMINFIGEIYQILFFSSITYLLIMLVFISMKWIGKRKFGIDSKLKLKTYEAIMLIISFGIFLSYIF